MSFCDHSCPFGRAGNVVPLRSAGPAVLRGSKAKPSHRIALAALVAYRVELSPSHRIEIIAELLSGEPSDAG